MIEASLYARIDPIIAPDIRAIARRYSYSLGEPVDDIIQDCRLHCLQSLAKYDYNQGFGRIRSFARHCLRMYLNTRYTRAKTARDVMVRHRTGKTMFHFDALDQGPGSFFPEDGSFKLIEQLVVDPADLDQLRWEQRMEEALLLVKAALRPRELAVFSCLHEWPAEFRAFIRNKRGEDGEQAVTQELVAEYLGLGGNAVDWCIHGINRVFTRVLESEFSDLVKFAVSSLKWPMIYLSEAHWDSAFISKQLERLSLDPRPVAEPKDRRRGQAQMHLETYSWGSVLFLTWDEKSITAVLVGRFNEITSEVIGQGGYWKSLKEVVPWYPAALRELKGK